jgi:hypothetical protein
MNPEFSFSNDYIGGLQTALTFARRDLAAVEAIAKGEGRRLGMRAYFEGEAAALRRSVMALEHAIKGATAEEIKP